MKKKIGLILLSVVLVATMGLGARTVNEWVQVAIARNVRVSLNGEVQTLRAGTGEVIYPIIHDGSSYLPVRAIANLAELDVDWDAESSTVLLGKDVEPWKDGIDVDELIERIDQLRGDNRQLQDDNARLEGESESLESKIQELESENNQLQRNNESLESDHEKEISELNQKIQELESENSQLQRRNESLESEDKKDTHNYTVETVKDTPTHDTTPDSNNAGDLDEVIVFNDENLEIAIRQTLEKPTGDITKEDAMKIKRLSLTINNNITDISPLADLTNLEWLTLNKNNITDISPLANLTNLETLYLHENNITNITALANLTNLEWLSLANNNITDISPLANLTSLQDLFLSFNRITDFSPIDNLPHINRADYE